MQWSSIQPAKLMLDDHNDLPKAGAIVTQSVQMLIYEQQRTVAEQVFY